MEVGGASENFMRYVAEIEQASFGSRSEPVGVDGDTVAQISKSANSKARNDQLENMVNNNKAHDYARMASTNSHTYSKNGGMSLSNGATFSIEV